MTDDTLRAATINNEFLRALGEMVIAASRLEQLEISTVEPAETDSRMPLWAKRARELLDERDRFIHAASSAHEGSTIVRVTARDGSVVPGDAPYIVHLAARMNRHRGAGLAMGVPLAPGYESTATGPMPISRADAG
jgi:hypothetical protein